MSDFHLWSEIFGHESDVKAVISSESGHVFSASRDRSVRMWQLGVDDVAVQTRAHTQHKAYINALTYVSAHGHVISGSADGSLVVWHLSLIHI